MVTTAGKTQTKVQDEEISPSPSLDAPDVRSEVDDPIVLRLPPQWRLTDQALFEIYELNEGLSFERTAEGDLVIVPVPHGPSSAMGTRISTQLTYWVDAGGRGEVRDSSAGYRLGPTPPPELEEKRPSREPDVSWISQEMLDEISDDDYETGEFSLCPPFVVELISAKQSVAPQKRKVREWMSYGVQLGWLIDRRRGKAWIYRAGQDEPEELDRPPTLSGESVLEGFTLDCAKIWR